MHPASAVILTLLLCHRVNYCGGSFLREKTSFDEENIFEQFVAEVKIHLDQRDLRHVTVVGASDDQLRQTKLLLEAFPYFVGTDAREICISRELAPDTLIIYFLANLEEDYLTKVIESLFHCKKNHIYFVFEGMDVSDVEVDLTLRLAFEKIAERPIFIHHGKKSLKLYGYKVTTDCHMKAELIVDWLPRANMNWREKYMRIRRVTCPISVGTKNRLPWMGLEKDVNGGSRIVGGLEGNMILTLAKKMGFTPVVQTFQFADNWRTDFNTVAIVSSCAAGKTDIGVVHIRPTKKVIEAVDISYSYAQECIVWCVPRITHWKNNIITSEFSWSTWVLIGLMFIASFVLEKIVRSMPDLNRGNTNNSGCCRIILDLIGSTLGNPIVYRPLSMGGKVLLMIYICYSLVITTAYKTSLSSILTVDNSVSSIVDLEGIIKANLTTGGDVYRLAILKDQAMENDFIPELIKRYEIEPNISKALHRVLFDKNFAYLTSLNDLRYHTHVFAQAGEPASFDVLNECVLTHSIVTIFPQSSRFTTQSNYLIQRLVESGLTEYWIKNISEPYRTKSGTDRSSEMTNTLDELHRLTRDKFYLIFYFYCLALAFCTLVFFGELLVHKFKFADMIQ